MTRVVARLRRGWCAVNLGAGVGLCALAVFTLALYGPRAATPRTSDLPVEVARAFAILAALVGLWVAVHFGSLLGRPGAVIAMDDRGLLLAPQLGAEPLRVAWHEIEAVEGRLLLAVHPLRLREPFVAVWLVDVEGFLARADVDFWGRWSVRRSVLCGNAPLIVAQCKLVEPVEEVVRLLAVELARVREANAAERK